MIDLMKDLAGVSRLSTKMDDIDQYSNIATRRLVYNGGIHTFTE